MLLFATQDLFCTMGLLWERLVMFDYGMSFEVMSCVDKSKASYTNRRGDETFVVPLWPKAVVGNSCMSKNKAYGEINITQSFSEVSGAEDS